MLMSACACSCRREVITDSNIVHGPPQMSLGEVLARTGRSLIGDWFIHSVSAAFRVLSFCAGPSCITTAALSSAHRGKQAPLAGTIQSGHGYCLDIGLQGETRAYPHPLHGPAGCD